MRPNKSALLNGYGHGTISELLEARLFLSSYTVTSLGDEVATITSTGPGQFNATTLRAALTAANAKVNADTIEFAPGLSGTLVLKKGELAINSQVAVNGPGAKLIAISGDMKSRVFNVLEDADASISNLTIERGDAGQAIGEDPSSPTHGGGVRNLGTLTIDNCVIRDNRAWADAGISNTETGILEVRNCSVINNSTWSWGAGGIGNNHIVNITDCLITENRANHGGGIVNSASMTIVRSTISNNYAGPMTIPSPNSAIDGLGGGIRSGRWVTLIDSTVSGNTATVAGGAFWVWYPVNAVQATIVNNRAPIGGAFYLEDSVSLTNCTVSGNIADTEGGAFAGYGSVLANNSILCGNSVGSAANDLDASLDSASRNNIIVVGGGLENNVNGNRVGVTSSSLKLGALANNGGSTETMDLLSGSAAIDAGSNVLCVGTDGLPLQADQRGLTRVVNGRVDVGAVEVQGAAFASVSAGLLTLRGSSAEDVTTIVPRGTKLDATLNGQTLSFLRSAVSRVQIDSFEGNDIIDCSTLAIPVTVNAGTGNDRVTGGTAADFLRGEGGKDTIRGGSGNDRIEGNAGNDYLIGGEGHDAVWAGTGDDRVEGNAGKDTLCGQAGNDALFGGSGNDRLDGGGGNDNLSGQAGADRILGGDGRDRFFARDNTRDILDGGGGYDSAIVDDLMDALDAIERVA